jgi:hypothetical protein
MVGDKLMSMLNEKQKQRAIEVMQAYLAAPAQTESKPSTEVSKRGLILDKERAKVIKEQLMPVLNSYLQNEIPLDNFKSTTDGINKRESYWGFKGIKGQMFFNLIVKVATDLDECDQELKAAIKVPENETIASSRIKTFTSYVKRISEDWVEAGNGKRGCPKVSSIPFFLSYFWQIQDPSLWPIYYTNSVQTMNDLNLWTETGDMGADYLAFKHIHEELVDLFTKTSGQTFSLYTVEHVFWHKAGKQSKELSPGDKTGAGDLGITVIEPQISEQGNRLPESFIPPIISVLPKMARNDEKLIEAAKNSGTILERAFEKFIDAAFTILGYQTKLLGQGKGRVPDGIAIAHDENYAMIWDAKIRANSYSMGTDDRTIREYIYSQSRDLKRRQHLQNIYYLIISSKYADDFDDSIRSIKMETDVNEVVLVEVEAIVEMVDAKLRSPLEVTLGSDGYQQLFAVSGLLTAENVRELLI